MIDGAEYGFRGPVYLAGDQAPPGQYRRLTGAPRDVALPDGGPLPASFDGQVALYTRLPDNRSMFGP